MSMQEEQNKKHEPSRFRPFLKCFTSLHLLASKNLEDDLFAVPFAAILRENSDGVQAIVNEALQSTPGVIWDAKQLKFKAAIPKETLLETMTTYKAKYQALLDKDEPPKPIVKVPLPAPAWNTSI